MFEQQLKTLINRKNTFIWIFALMPGISSNHIFVIISVVTGFSSCAIFKPLPLKPVDNTQPIQIIGQNSLRQFNGVYELRSADSNSNTLEYTFTYKSLYNLQQLPGYNDYIQLSSIDERHISATLFVNDKIVKSKKIKGKVKNNYFEFHSNCFSLKYIFFLYRKQTNRLAISKEGDLFLDTNKGGVGFLLIVPIPLSGSSIDMYNLRFKRKNNTE